MIDPQLALVMLGTLGLAVVLGFPIAFALLGLGLAFGAFAMGANIVPLLAQRVYGIMTTEVLVAIPLLVLTANVVERTHLPERLHAAFDPWSRGRATPAGLGVLGTCALFGAATGSVGAIVLSVGLLALPRLLRAGLDSGHSAGLICAASCLGLVLPPSLVLVVYGAASGVPVPRLFAGALLPALLLIALYALYILAKGAGAAPRPRERFRFRPGARPRRGPDGSLWRLLGAAAPFLGMSALVLGPVLSGAVALWEGAGMAALAGLVLSLCDGSLSWASLKQSLFLTARTTARLAWLMAGSAVFMAVFGYLGGPTVLSNLALASELPASVLLILAQFIIFTLGWPLEWPEIVIVFVPFMLPLLEGMGVDPLLFGVLLALNIQTSFLSPPVATPPQLLTRAVSAKLSIDQVFLGAMPFVCIVVLEMVALYLWPGIALWLPGLLGR